MQGQEFHSMIPVEITSHSAILGFCKSLLASPHKGTLLIHLQLFPQQNQVRENSPAAILSSSPYKMLCPSQCSSTASFLQIPVIPVPQLCTWTWLSHFSCVFVVLGVFRYSKESLILLCPVLCLLPLIHSF